MAFWCFFCPWIEDNLYICPETQETNHGKQNRIDINPHQSGGTDRTDRMVTAILSKYQVDIMDIGQADIHTDLVTGYSFKCSDQ